MLSLVGGNLGGWWRGKRGSLAATASHRDVGGRPTNRGAVVDPGTLAGQHVVGGLGVGHHGGQGGGGCQVSLRDCRHLGLRGGCSVLALRMEGCYCCCCWWWWWWCCVFVVVEEPVSSYWAVVVVFGGGVVFSYLCHHTGRGRCCLSSPSWAFHILIVGQHLGCKFLKHLDFPNFFLWYILFLWYI